MSNPPLKIVLMLHYYAVMEPYAKNDPRHANSSAVATFTNELLAQGLIIESPEDGSGYEPTERGRVWVDMLCNVPYPISKWVAP